MKQSIFLILLALPMMLSAQDRHRDSKNWNLDGFQRISNHTRANIFIQQGSTFSIEARGTRAFIRRLRISESGGELKIRTRPMFGRFGRNQEIHITLPELTELKNTGSGDAEISDAFSSDNFRLHMTGSGDSNLRLDVRDLEIVLTGSGSTQITNSTATDSCYIRITGSGSADVVTEANNLDITLTGSGSLNLQTSAQRGKFKITGSGDFSPIGFVDQVEIDINGSGDFDGEQFTVQSADIEITGSGECTLIAEEEMTVKITGSGDIHYGGSPQISDIRITGSGKVTAID